MIMKELENIISEINILKGVENNFTLKKETRLVEDLGMDSLDLATLTAKIEDKYNIDIFEDGFVRTIEDIVVKLRK